MGKNRKKNGRRGKPAGATYADVLARERFLKKAAVDAVRDTAVEVQADIRTQKTLWLGALALNDAFGFGHDRYEELALALDQRTQWYLDMVDGADQEYADEKLRQEAERVTRTEIKKLYDVRGDDIKPLLREGSA